MQISGGPSAARNISAIDPAQPARRRAHRSGSRGGDTVSLSEEALALFRNSKRQEGTGADADTGAKFRQALEEAWSETGSDEGSLFGKLRAALGTWNNRS